MSPLWWRTLLVAGSIALLTPCASGQPQVKKVPLSKTDPALVLVFSHCPAGKVRPGDPADNSPEVDVTEFHIAQTELTVAQLRALLGQAAVDRMRKQIADRDDAGLLEDEYYMQMFDPARGAEFPAFCLTLDDVAALCRELNRRQMQGPERQQRALADPLAEIEADDFRLPTHLQWQYACRGPRQPGAPARPHFGAWLTLDEFPDDHPLKQKSAQLKARWKETQLPGEFTGTQDQILALSRLSKDHPKRDDANKLLLEYLTAVLAPPDEAKRKEEASGGGELARVGKTRSNAWGLFDMHDNVSEWVLMVDTPQQYNLLWQDLLLRGSAAARTEPRVFLAGGHFNDNFFGENALSRFTAWGGPVMPQGKAVAIPYVDDKSQADTLRANPGVRLVIVRGLADDWFYLFRKAWMPDGKKPVDAAKQAEIARKVEQVFNRYLPVDHPARDQVKFYQSLARGPGSASEELKKLHTKLIDQAPTKPKNAADEQAYLELLSGLEAGDRKKP